MGPKVSQVRVFKLSGLEDPGAKHHLTLSTARQEEEEEEVEVEEVKGDRKPHSQDNERSVGLAETPRALGHVEEKEGKIAGGRQKKKDVKKSKNRGQKRETRKKERK